MSNQTNELKNMMASFFQMNTASTSGTGSLPSNTVANPKGELKAITTRSGLVLDGPTVPIPPPFVNPEEDERIEETLTDPKHGEFTIKVPPPLVQKAKPPSQRNYVVHQRDPRHPHIPYPSRMNQEKQKEKDEVQIHKFWQMFKQLHINITLADALILISKYQKMLKSLLSNKEKLLELANTPLNENCSAVILKKLPEKLGDPGKFLIPCGFSLPELISTQMTLELANREICTPVGIARDVFVPVGKFTFPADFVIVDYERDPRFPLILGRPFLRTARALIDIHGEEMILQGDIIENLLNLDKTKDLPPYHDNPLSGHFPTILDFSNRYQNLPPYHDNPLSGNPTLISEPATKSSSPTLTFIEESDLIWEEFEAYLASDSFPPGNDDLPFDAESDLQEVEYLLNHDPIKEMDSILEDLVDSPNDNLTVNDDTYDDPFDSKEEKIKDSKILIDELDPPGSSDFLPFPECDSVFYEDFSKVDTLSSTNNEDKDFNPPLYELPFHKEVPGFGALLSFSSKNEEKVFNPEIITFKGVHTSLLPELSHRGPKAFKVIKFLKARWRFFLALMERTSVFWMFRVFTSIPLDQSSMGGLGQAK
ncbi:reverse transcriptase domain-containing protein [Tanacetum coccineum]